jgi:hypothetical protein
MAQKRPQTITLSEIEKAVTSAVQQVQHQKALTGEDLAKGSLIMGRWIRDLQVAQGEAEAAAKEITRQVGSQVAGLNASHFAVSGPGGTTMGFILNEE